MKTNMGWTDRILRILLSVTVVILFCMQIISGTLGIVLLVVAGVFTLTAIAGRCPLYLPFGISTRCEKKC